LNLPELFLNNKVMEYPKTIDGRNLFVFGSNDLLHFIERYKQYFQTRDFQTGKTVYEEIQVLHNLNTKGRDIIETLVATKQCEYIYRHSTPTNCWLCGFHLSEDTVDCEHIIPAAAALLFHGLIEKVDDTNTKGSKGSQSEYREDKGDVEFFKLNYDLAHHSCNTVKRNILFVNLLTTDDTFVNPVEINQTHIQTFLDMLYRKYFATNPNINGIQWKQTQMQNIIKRLSPLVDNIQHTGNINSLLGFHKLETNIHYLYSKSLDSTLSLKKFYDTRDVKLAETELPHLTKAGNKKSKSRKRTFRNKRRATTKK
jgi:hypothetical protein